jgi:hypothetical protein
MKSSAPKKSNIILLRERNHPAIPKHLLMQEFGSETIVDSNDGSLLAHGTSVYLSGPIEEIRAWIKSAGGKVWTSNNPMVGAWTQRSFEE